jgi:RanBP-type and C3HC4-type zinc finger-containing protein 1
MRFERCEKEIKIIEIQALLSAEKFAAFIEKRSRIKATPRRSSNFIPKLIDLESNYDYVENKVKFECPICLTVQKPGDGLVLKNCLHEYCKICLAHHIEHSDEMEVSCPFRADDGTKCEGFLQDRELRALITEQVYNAHLVKSLSRAEAVIKNSFHCQTVNCHGWVEIDSEFLLRFYCPVCKAENCIKCKAIHPGKTCEEFYYENNEDARKVRDDKLTQSQLQILINNKKAMPCPGCGVIIEKTVGCNHMKCTRCQKDFQWQGLQ